MNIQYKSQAMPIDFQHIGPFTEAYTPDLHNAGRRKTFESPECTSIHEDGGRVHSTNLHFEDQGYI